VVSDWFIIHEKSIHRKDAKLFEFVFIGEHLNKLSPRKR